MREIDPDARLMVAFGGGDMAAFDKLFERWKGPLLRYLDRIVHDAATAEELVQEAFLRVHGARDRYVADAKFSTWLYRIATNLAFNELRRPNRRYPHASTDAPEGPTELRMPQPGPDEIAHARLVGEMVDVELAHLPDRQRVALWLCAVEGLSYREIAGVLETSEKSVKALVHRARAKLAERMSERGTEV